MDGKITGIFIDALRSDFVTKEHMPFLYNVSKENPSSELETILGYSDAIDATIFTGTYPDVHGYWMKYQYNPAKSPFKNMNIIRPLKILDSIPDPFIRSGCNFVLYHTLYKHLSKKFGYELASYNIPYNILSNFDFTLKKSLTDETPFDNVPTIYDLLRSTDQTYYFTNCIKRDTIRRLKKANLGIIYFDDVDFSAHLFGICSPLFFHALKKLDNKIKFIFENLNQDPKRNIIVFSDHGMANVQRILTFERLLKHKEFGKRYLLALDGTMIRFWYFDDGIKDHIRNMLEDKSYGHFLDDKELSSFRINFPHNLYGDDIFLLDQGYSIYPNFMSWAKPKAMHAYDPGYKEQRGFIILHGKLFENGIRNKVNIADIMPTMLDILKMEIPTVVEGKSLIR